MKATFALIPDKAQATLDTEELDASLLAPGQILVQAERTVMSGGTELAAFTALSKSVYKKDGWNAYPWRPGYGLVGRVVAAAPERTRGLKAGERIFCFGKHASLQIYDLDSPKPFRAAFRIGEDLDAEAAVVARLALVSMTALQMSEVRPGHTVLVLGMGLVGNFAAQLYRIAGARVFVHDPVAGRRDVARGVGLEVLEGDDPIQAVRDATDGRGVDIAVDAAGLGPVCAMCVEACAPYGQVVLLGSPRPPFETNLTAVFNRIHMQWLTVRGALEWRLPPYRVPGGGPSVEENLERVHDWIRSGALKTEGLVSHVIQPEALLSAYRGMLDDKEHYHGVIVDWSKHTP
ncbi:MAG: zinc-binding alcohol dehydrogenase [Deltaproteobacteria bacterium]